MWPLTLKHDLKNNRVPVLYCVRVRKLSIRVKIGDFFLIQCDFEIWWMTLKNNRAPLLYYVKLCPSFQSHRWIQTWVTVRKRSIRFLVRCRLKIWRLTLKNNKFPHVCGFKLSASFHSHQWILTGITVRKRPIWFKIGDCLAFCDLEIWYITIRNNRTHLLCYFKLCASLHHYIQPENG